MKRSFKIENLDCAVCANKMESLVRKVEGVSDCTVTFMSGRMVIEADNFDDELMKKIVKAVKKIDSCCEVV